MSSHTPDQIRQTYQDLAPRYDRGIAVMERVTGIRRLRRELFGHASGAVLDVAAGTGRNFGCIPADCTITAVDLSSEMLEIARRRAAQLGRSVDCCVMDAEALAFPDASFDTVLSSLTVCTYPHPVSALREMARVCKSDGRVLLLEHGRSSVRALGWLQDRMADAWDRKHACRWDLNPLALAQEAGLQILSHREAFFGVVTAMEAMPSIAGTR